MTLDSLPTEQTARTYQVGGTHYVDCTIQPWDAMESWMTREQFAGFLLGNAIKYLARGNKKPPDHALVDLKKAQHYLAKLIETATPQ
jgi:hypothetical protein